jgi:hypothetical protein
MGFEGWRTISCPRGQFNDFRFKGGTGTHGKNIVAFSNVIERIGN